MIRHCVFVRFRPQVTDADRDDLLRQIRGLRGRLPGLIAAYVGSNVSPEIGMDKGYSDGFIVDFADAAARDAYLDDADHRVIGAKLVEAAAGGAEGILVFDLHVDG